MTLGMPAEASTGTAVVIDTSAIVGILRDEPDAAALIKRAISFERRVMAAPTWLEAAIVCESKNPSGRALFDRLVKQLRMEVQPFTVAQAAIARKAYRKFGKGRGSKAQLSFGDCFSYALAKHLGAPLLFKGNDFGHTDVMPA